MFSWKIFLRLLIVLWLRIHYKRRRFCEANFRDLGPSDRSVWLSYLWINIHCSYLAVSLMSEDITTEKVTSRRMNKRILFNVQPPEHTDFSFADFSNLKVEAFRSSEGSIYTRSTCCHIPEKGILHNFVFVLELSSSVYGLSMLSILNYDLPICCPHWAHNLH